jgi:hypothetical protein
MLPDFFQFPIYFELDPQEMVTRPTLKSFLLWMKTLQRQEWAQGSVIVIFSSFELSCFCHDCAKITQQSNEKFSSKDDEIFF